MRKFELLPHKADLKIRFFGETKEKLFESAMLGMQSALRPKIKNLPRPFGGTPKGRGQTPKVKKKIKINSLDLSALLVDFLSELNYLNEVNSEVYDKIKFLKFSDTELEGEISGKKVERFGLAIKGVTYHDLDIRQRGDKIWEATVLFDI